MKKASEKTYREILLNGKQYFDKDNLTDDEYVRKENRKIYLSGCEKEYDKVLELFDKGYSVCIVERNSFPTIVVLKDSRQVMPGSCLAYISVMTILMSLEHAKIIEKYRERYYEKEDIYKTFYRLRKEKKC